MNSILEEIKVSNIDLPEAIENGPQSTGYFNEWNIFVDGQIVDTAYGNEQQAWQAYYQAKREIQRNGKPDMETPWEELKKKRGYWKNEDCPPLRLDEPEDAIPWQGEPVTASSEYGLEARG